MRIADRGLRNQTKKQRGVSLIATVFIIVILAFMGVMFVSLINTGSLTSVNDMQSAQALSIAEGGVEYVLGSRIFPNYSMAGASQALGAGNFSIATPAYLTGGINIGDTTINVNSTTGFASPSGMIVIDSEVIPYIGTGANSFTPAVPATAAHANGSAVYPVTRVANVALPNNCTATDIQADSTVNFLIPGVIIIGSEYVFCAGTASGPTRFTGCTRCYKGSSSALHAVGSAVFQYAVTSTGAVGNARRVVRESGARAGGEAVTNGTFPNGSLGSWPDGNCPPNKKDGAGSVTIDMTTSATADGTGSLRVRTDTGKRQAMDDCVVQNLATPIPASTPVTLSLQFQFLSTHACSNTTTNTTATCLISVVFVYSDTTTQPVWTNASYPASWTSTGNIPLTTKAGANLTALRLSYTIESANANGAQATGWIDDVSLIIPGCAAVLSWQEVVN